MIVEPVRFPSILNTFQPSNNPRKTQMRTYPPQSLLNPFGALSHQLNQMTPKEEANVSAEDLEVLFELRDGTFMERGIQDVAKLFSADYQRSQSYWRAYLADMRSKITNEVLVRAAKNGAAKSPLFDQLGAGKVVEVDLANPPVQWAADASVASVVELADNIRLATVRMRGLLPLEGAKRAYELNVAEIPFAAATALRDFVTEVIPAVFGNALKVGAPAPLRAKAEVDAWAKHNMMSPYYVAHCTHAAGSALVADPKMLRGELRNWAKHGWGLLPECVREAISVMVRLCDLSAKDAPHVNPQCNINRADLIAAYEAMRHALVESAWQATFGGHKSPSKRGFLEIPLRTWMSARGAPEAHENEIFTSMKITAGFR